MKTFLFTAAKSSVLALGVAMGLASPSASAPISVFPSAPQTMNTNIIQVRNEYDSGSRTSGDNIIRRAPRSSEGRRSSERRVEQRRGGGDRSDWRRNDRRGDWRRGDGRRSDWRGGGRRDDWRRHGRHDDWRRHHRRDGWRRDYYRGGGSGIYFGFGAPAYRYEQPRYYAPAPRRVYRTNLSRAHVDWCLNRYRSYRPYDNTFQPYNGPRQQCWSPYT